jgi:four helix bundle suffix protein
MASPAEGFIAPHGGYKKLYSFQRARIVYDATVYFTRRFFEKRDRTVDQMIQAARSGKQNIVEGSLISATSKEMEIKLTNVARASLEELLEDYRDFLRTRGLHEWQLHDAMTEEMRQLNRLPGANYDTFRPMIEHADPAISANAIIGLIKLTSYLLANQVKYLERDFLEHGGIREAMARARKSRFNT